MPSKKVKWNLSVEPGNTVHGIQRMPRKGKIELTWGNFLNGLLNLSDQVPDMLRGSSV